MIPGFSQDLILALSTASLVMFVASVFVTPWLLVRLPADYFCQEKPHLLQKVRAASPGRACVLVLKNALGLVLLVAGVLMLVLPGQGLLTIVVAFVLMDFPGKFHAERWVVHRPKVADAINWLRRRYKRAPLKL